MGRYIDWEFLSNRYPLVERGPSADEVNSFHILYAEAELDGMLAEYFTVPFSSNNLTVRELAAMGTYLSMGILRDEHLGQLMGKYRSRIKRLKKGEEVMIVVTDSGTIETLSPSDTVVGAISSTTKDYHPVFGMGDITEFQVDSERLIDEDDERD